MIFKLKFLGESHDFYLGPDFLSPKKINFIALDQSSNDFYNNMSLIVEANGGNERKQIKNTIMKEKIERFGFFAQKILTRKFFIFWKKLEKRKKIIIFFIFK